MGVIQNAINQTLGTAGIAARLSPQLEKLQETRLAKKEEKQLKETTIQLSQEVTDVGKRIQAEADLGLQEKRIENAKKQQELGLRTPGNAAAIISNEKKGMQIAKLLENKQVMIKPYSAEQFLNDRQVQALKKVDTIKDAKNIQKARMTRYPEDLKKTINILKGRDITNGK